MKINSRSVKQKELVNKELHKTFLELRRKVIKRFNQLGITEDWPEEHWNPLRMHLRALEREYINQVSKVNEN